MGVELAKLIWVLLCLVLVTVSAIYFVSVNKFIKILENDYKEVWKSQGEFNILTNNSIKSSNKIIKFIMSGAYKKVDSVVVVRLGRRCRVLLILGLGLSLVVFILPILIGNLK